MDGGKTWSTEDRILQRCADAQNLMSVSFLRLKDGRLAMFYLRKDSTTLCRPVMTVSADEGRTWGPWKALLDDQGWYISNNARVTRLKGGRILLPVAFHDRTGGKFSPPGDLFALYSDDDGLTWRKSSVVRAMQDGERVVTQEPGVIELKDGRVKMWTRTDRGCQWSAESMDGGATWGNARPWTLVAPCSPATVNRLSDGRLIAVWNDHTGFSTKDGRRTPLVAAFSSDEGETWLGRTVLENDPDGFFCYTAVLELSDKLLFGYCVKTEHNLDTLRISLMPSIEIQCKKE